jgi:predicted AlkP superfamily phosphohydrolase/phosphomutase
MTPRILVIGLDAATMDLIGPWAAAGQLPALAALMREGAATSLLSTPNMHSASAWTSILTGLNPGRHGMFVFSDRDFATGKQVFFKGGDRTGDLIGTHLAARGLTSGFVNVPMTYPATAEPGGFMISGLDAPSLNERAFRPASLRAEVLERFPTYHFQPQDLGRLMRSGKLEDAARAWIKLIDTQTDVAEYLLKNRPVDFFMTVYTASDWAGHNMWEFRDSARIGGVNCDRSYPNSPLGIYIALDRAVARLLRYAGDAQVYVISDHGMGPHTGASYHLAEWLQERGYMKRRDKQRGSFSNAPIFRPSFFFNAGRRAAGRLLPASVKGFLKAGLGEHRVEQLRASDKDSFYSSIDWNGTSAYTEPGRHVININLEGRNASGCVPQAEYDQVRSQIIEELSKWTDAQGNKVVDRVVRREEVYFGPFADCASDLYVYWNLNASLSEPPDEVRDRGFWWSGDHRPEGILICKGPGIQRNAKLATPQVYDLVPTIMYGAGLPIPDGLDGKVIQDAFTGEFRDSHAIRIASASARQDAGKLELSADEEKMIEEKLRGLGYL